VNSAHTYGSARVVDVLIFTVANVVTVFTHL